MIKFLFEIAKFYKSAISCTIIGMFKFDKKRQVKVLSFILKHFYTFESWFYNCKNINSPKESPAIYALWHSHQCGLYALENRANVNVMVSKSNDGEIIAAATERVGLKVIRGSHKRSGTSASLAMLEKLEQGECAAITIDGPRGPNRIVKDGVINIAKLSQVPIIPMTWYSPSKWLLKFNTWDEFRFPLLGVKTIALYGDPIYVPSDCSKEDIEMYRQQLENALNDLYKKAEENFKEYRPDY